MSFKQYSRLFLLSFVAQTAWMYQWPSPKYDALEELLYLGQDRQQTPVGLISAGCATRLDKGTPAGVEWLRLAYHDMSTHNITDGSGGLDASIYYEYDRAENIGNGIVDSLNDFAQSANKYVSVSDIIAMGAIWGITGCGGPPIPFRAGRIDATKAGCLGVPEPQQDLAEHTEKFRLQGFSSTEMISLVACGHAFGSVRNRDFPDIVTDPIESNGSTVFAFFDTTNEYDNKVATEYISGTTKNPLVVTANVTERSDQRIFASDGNVTMQGLTSATTFTETCTSLLTRMIDTVPSGVQLTEEISFLPFKVENALFKIIGETPQLALQLKVRVQRQSAAIPDVTVKWCDAHGQAAACADGQAHFSKPIQDLIGSTGFSPLGDAKGLLATTYIFTIPLDSSTSIGKFWFEVKREDGNVTVEDNNGGGYEMVQDTLFVNSITLNRLVNTSENFFSTSEFGVTVAVRENLTPESVNVYLQDFSIPFFAQQSFTPIYHPPVNETISLSVNTTIPSAAGYKFYTKNIESRSGATLNFAAVANGQLYELDFIPLRFNFFRGNETSNSGKEVLTSHERSLLGHNTSGSVPDQLSAASGRQGILSGNIAACSIALSLLCTIHWKLW